MQNNQVVVNLLLAVTIAFSSVRCQLLDVPHLELDEQLLAGSVSGYESCKPSLNLSSFFERPSSKVSQDSSVHTGFRASFPIGDIDFPVIPKEVNSAVRFLSTFGSQLDPDLSNGDGTTEQAENIVRFRDNKVHIEGFNLTMLNVHLYARGEPRIGLGFNIKNTTLAGRFQYAGSILPVAVVSNMTGFYRMSIENIYLIISTNLTRKSGTLGEPVPLTTNGFKVNVTNMGYISITISHREDTTEQSPFMLWRLLQRVLQRTIKRIYYTFENSIRDSLEREGRKYIDCELSAVTPSFASSLDNLEQDVDFGRLISGQIQRSQLDKVNLPDFYHQQNVLGSLASVYFSNGTISGLSNVLLTGETRVKLQDEHLIVNSSIGWINLAPRYNWTLYLGSGNQSVEARGAPTAKGFVSFHIKGVSISLFERVLSSRPTNTNQLCNLGRLRRHDKQRFEARVACGG